MPDGFFEAIEGLELKPADIDRLHSRGYTPREAKKSEVWQELAGRSQDRLDKYVDAIAAETGRTQDLMNTYFGPVSKVPTGRFWFVYNRLNGSSADGYGNLTSVIGRLVGVAPEAHVSGVIARSARKK